MSRLDRDLIEIIEALIAQIYKICENKGIFEPGYKITVEKLNRVATLVAMYSVTLCLFNVHC